MDKWEQIDNLMLLSLKESQQREETAETMMIESWHILSHLRESVWAEVVEMELYPKERGYLQSTEWWNIPDFEENYEMEL